METIKSEITPEAQAALAGLSSYFGIRPGTLHTGTLEVFETLPEQFRPQITIEYMTSSARAEYADRMGALSSDTPKDETVEQRNERLLSILKEKRKEHDAVNEWLIKKHLVSITNYRDATRPGEFIDIKREGAELSAASWEAIAFALRPHIATFIITKNFVSELEANAVKS